MLKLLTINFNELHRQIFMSFHKLKNNYVLYLPRYLYYILTHLLRDY